MRRINIGVLGCAKIAIRSMIPELVAHPAFQLVAVASRSREKAQQTATQAHCQAVTYDELVADPAIDAVYIPLPTGLHAEWVTKCLVAGKHVICEKSLGCTLAEVETMVALAKKQKRMLMENFQFRFHSQHATVKRMITDGLIGEIRHFRCSFGFPPFKDGASNIRYQKKLGGGALLDAGAYTIKATTFMLGHAFQVKAASLRTAAGYQVDIGGSISLEGENAVVSQTAFGFDNFYQCNYEIWGSKGKVTACRAFTAPPNVSPEIRIELEAGTKVQSLSPDNHFEQMLTHFSRSVSSESYADECEENLVQARLLQQAFDVSKQ